ncbi:hypothetical protein EJB05_51401, partial [Eragrostis curvula]
MSAAVHRDWSGLPEDLMLIVMRALAIPDLLRAGAVCVSWRAASADVRRIQFPITDASPCLLYTCAADDDDTATVYSVSTGALFKVRLPPSAAPFRSRHVVGSGRGWVVTADDAPRFQALNPLTGAQTSRRSRGSTTPANGSACAILLVHQCSGYLYFTHVGNNRWTRITTQNTSVPLDICFHSAVYNQNDGLFYVLSFNSSVFALDLSGPSPTTVRTVFTGREEAVLEWLGYNHGPRGNIILTPWGDILQVWRSKRRYMLNTPIFNIPESFIDDILLCKVDIHEKRLVRISGEDLRGHALFLGFNASMCLLTKDFPGLKPNCTYVTNGSWRQPFITKFGSQEVGIWNFETKTLESLGKVQSDHPWLDWPSPIWITPSLS